jgi:hypothetical protein
MLSALANLFEEGNGEVVGDGAGGADGSERDFERTVASVGTTVTSHTGESPSGEAHTLSPPSSSSSSSFSRRGGWEWGTWRQRRQPANAASSSSSPCGGTGSAAGGDVGGGGGIELQDFAAGNTFRMQQQRTLQEATVEGGGELEKGEEEYVHYSPPFMTEQAQQPLEAQHDNRDGNQDDGNGSFDSFVEHPSPPFTFSLDQV